MSVYRLIDHTADCGIEVEAADASDLFAGTARAMFELLATAPGPPDGLVDAIDITGTDWTDLMINWLRELLYLFNAKQRVVREIRITALDPQRIAARLTCDRLDPQRHELGDEIKAVTYHQASVTADGDRWTARIIFDV